MFELRGLSAFGSCASSFVARCSRLALGPGAEGRSHYLGGGSLLRLPSRAELRAANEERTRVQRGSADLVRDHASRLRIRII
eukprot:scaffold14414_cov114-Isochrysis_galbana.AAC.1